MLYVVKDRHFTLEGGAVWMGRHAGKVPVAIACLLTAGGRSGFRRTSHYCNWTDGNNNNKKGGGGSSSEELGNLSAAESSTLNPIYQLAAPLCLVLSCRYLSGPTARYISILLRSLRGGRFRSSAPFAGSAGVGTYMRCPSQS